MILFITLYVISVILIWTYIHIDIFNEHGDDSSSVEKGMTIFINFCPILNTVLCLLGISAILIFLIGLGINKLCSKINFTYKKFYKLK